MFIHFKSSNAANLKPHRYESVPFLTFFFSSLKLTCISEEKEDEEERNTRKPVDTGHLSFRFLIFETRTSIWNEGTILIVRYVTVSKNELPRRKSALLYRGEQWEEKITAGQKWKISPHNAKRERIVLRHVSD